MAIRDRVRRALHKSTASSNSSASQTDSSNITTTTTATTASSETSSNSSSPSLRHHTSKFFSWRSSERNEPSGKSLDMDKRKKKKGKPIHPRDRPLTATNLRHQEMLSHFTMTFGSSANRLSQIVAADFELGGVSPCCTRPPSISGLCLGPDDSVDTGARPSLDDEVPPPITKVN